MVRTTNGKSEQLAQVSGFSPRGAVVESMNGCKTTVTLPWEEAGKGSRAFKGGLFGETGSGKTTTGALLALSIAKRLKKNAAYMIDSEGGADFIASLFKAHGITLNVIRTREFGVLVNVFEVMHAQDDVIFVDSVSHFSDDVARAYLQASKRSKLRLQDFPVIYETWRQFTQPFVTSSLNAIVCGRLSNVYETAVDESGDLEFYKSDAKMKASDKFGHEPDLLLHMEQMVNAEGLDKLSRASTKRERQRVAVDLQKRSALNIRATVRKDRTRLLMGKQFTFVPGNDDEAMLKAAEDAFSPVIDWHIKNEYQAGIVETGATREMLAPAGNEFDWQEKKRRREVALDEIKSTLQQFFPSSTSPAHRKAIVEIQEQVFGVKSWTSISETLALEQLEAVVVKPADGTPTTLEKACVIKEAQLKGKDPV